MDAEVDETVSEVEEMDAEVDGTVWEVEETDVEVEESVSEVEQADAGVDETVSEVKERAGSSLGLRAPPTAAVRSLAPSRRCRVLRPTSSAIDVQ